MRIISDIDVKTDPIDARRLTNALRAGMVPKCYVAPPGLWSVMELMRCRIGPVQARTAVINRIHGLPDRYYERIDSSHAYSDKGLRQLTDMAPDDPNDGAVLGAHTRRVRQPTEEIADIETKIAAQAGASEDARIPMSIPGIDSRPCCWSPRSEILADSRPRASLLRGSACVRPSTSPATGSTAAR